MSDFKQASKLKLRFSTDKGILSVEQLWDLSLTNLANLIRSAKKILKKADDDELSFLDSTKEAVNVEDQLRFDILKEVFLEKQSEVEESKKRTEAKLHNQKINELIAKKKEQSLESMSIEDLEKLRK